MSTKKKEKPINPCPACWDDSKEINPLEYQPGRYEHYCSKNHTYPDREILVPMMLRVQSEIKAAGGQNPPAPVAPEPIKEEAPDSDTTVVQAAPEDKTAPIPHGTQQIVVGPVDYIRLSDILGTFTDSSSMFGAVFALRQQLLDTQELLERSKSKSQLSTIRTLGGEEMVQVVIPERHVQPLKDVAEANGMDMTRYLNSRFEDALDNLWFY